MSIVGRVDSLWRYPVKSMRGEELREAFAGFPGIYGDRLYAIRSSVARAGFPYLTAREQAMMLMCRPAFRHPGSMVEPLNLKEAASGGIGTTPLYATPAETIVDVELPTGEVLAVDDPRLLERLGDGLRDDAALSLIQSERALTDCRPISIISRETVRQLGDEAGRDLDKRRFRANVFIDLASGAGFSEDAWVGRRLRIGANAEVAVMARDTRCKMITLDPDTAEPDPEVMRVLAKSHDTKAGVYGVVLIEGTIRAGDEIKLMD